MALPTELESFFDVFEQLEDPRVDRTKLHPLPEILLVTVCGVAAGCDGWADIELFAKQRLDFLRNYKPFTHGVPSDDTLRRFFRAVNPQRFQALFSQWIGQCLSPSGSNETIAIDGKTLRGSRDGGDRALHLVSAYASEARLVLGQCAVDKKSNEITAIPQVLDALDMTGATITIDAMGCQHKIANQIVGAGGHYVLGLKGNQGALHDDVVAWFDSPPKGASLEQDEQTDKGHGRVEVRKISVCKEVSWLHERHPLWNSIGSIVQLESERHVGDKCSREKRYYVGSCQDSAQELLKAIRSHWSVENNLHWVLDMSFGEDQSRIRKGNAPNNIAVIRHAVLNAINTVKPKRTSVKQMRKLAGWDNQTLVKVLEALI
ncbi:ISAs1 family transposase [Porticoccus sp. GXU_MW_L64]